MPKKMLVVTGGDTSADPLLRLEVLAAEMVFPGWIRFELEPSAPDWTRPTVCWYRVPEAATHIELQEEITDEDVRRRLREEVRSSDAVSAPRLDAYPIRSDDMP